MDFDNFDEIICVYGIMNEIGGCIESQYVKYNCKYIFFNYLIYKMYVYNV